MLKIHTLRECGNYKKYLELQARIFALCPLHARKKDHTLFKIISWLDRQIDSFTPLDKDSDDAVVISLLVFGEAYLNKMLKYTFKSMMAFENLPCLASEKRVIFYIQTDAKSRDLIQRAEITNTIRGLGVHFEYAIIPDDLIEALSDQDITYWMLGAVASLGLEYAKLMEATFHHSYPDIVYSDKFFSELLRLSKQGHKSILGPGMRSDETLLLPALEPYTSYNNISVSSADLLAHHMDALHAAAWGFVVNHKPAFWLYPQSHVMIWESEDSVHFNCPHMNAWWLDYGVIKNLKPRYYMTLDSELDLICQGENYYVPQLQDQIYQAELSPPDRQELTDVFSNATQVANGIWSTVSHRDTVKFFFKEMRVKINRDIRPLPENFIPKIQVETLQRYLYNTIMAVDPLAGIALVKDRTHTGYVFV